jgi:phosphoketolase
MWPAQGTAGRHWSPATWKALQRGISEHLLRRGGHEAPVPQFSFRWHSQSRRAGNTGSIHEGGELGYALSYLRRAFDNPDLIVACVVGMAGRDRAAGDGGASKFLDRRGTVRPADPPT